MPGRRLEPGRMLPMLLALSAPTALVLLVLGVAGWAHPVAAAAGLVAAVPLTWLVLRPFLADLLAVADHLRALAGPGEPPPPAVERSAVAEEQLAALALLRRSWAQTRAELEATVVSDETIIDSLPDPLFFLDAQRRVARANLAARRLFGAAVVGRELASFLRDPGVLDAVDRVLGGRGGEDLELLLPLPLERTFRARVEPLPMRAMDGTVAVLALHDLTALKRIERMRADFVANASHELRTPLSALLGFIETLQGPARDDAEARERFLGIMQEQAARMSRLVNDLLSLSRIELNEHTQPMDRVDAARLLTQVAEGLAPHAANRGARIDLDLPEGLPAVVGKADELAQVFQNLMDNAIKYGRDGAAVEVSARHVAKAPTAMGQPLEHGAVAVAVRDHGEGIAKEHLPRLTERFYRVDTARSRSMGGTGLGLAIVKHVVNRHRGALTIDSTLGQGSVFTVYIPAAAD